MIKDSALNERATAVEIGGLVDGVGAPVMRAGYALKRVKLRSSLVTPT